MIETDHKAIAIFLKETPEENLRTIRIVCIWKLINIRLNASLAILTQMLMFCEIDDIDKILTEAELIQNENNHPKDGYCIQRNHKAQGSPTYRPGAKTPNGLARSRVLLKNILKNH